MIQSLQNCNTFRKIGGVVPPRIANVVDSIQISGLSTKTAAETWLSALEVAMNPEKYPDQDTHKHLRKMASFWHLTQDVDTMHDTMTRARTAPATEPEYAIEVKRGSVVAERSIPLADPRRAFEELKAKRANYTLDAVKVAAERILLKSSASDLSVADIYELESMACRGIGSAAKIARQLDLRAMAIQNDDAGVPALNAIREAAKTAKSNEDFVKIATALDTFDGAFGLSYSELATPEQVCFSTTESQIKQAAEDILTVGSSTYSRRAVSAVPAVKFAAVSTELGDAVQTVTGETNVDALMTKLAALSSKQRRKVLSILDETNVS